MRSNDNVSHSRRVFDRFDVINDRYPFEDEDNSIEIVLIYFEYLLIRLDVDEDAFLNEEWNREDKDEKQY